MSACHHLNVVEHQSIRDTDLVASSKSCDALGSFHANIFLSPLNPAGQGHRGHLEPIPEVIGVKVTRAQQSPTCRFPVIECNTVTNELVSFLYSRILQPFWKKSVFKPDSWLSALAPLALEPNAAGSSARSRSPQLLQCFSPTLFLKRRLFHGCCCFVRGQVEELLLSTIARYFF